MLFQKAVMHDVDASQGLILVASQTDDRLRGMGDDLPTGGPQSSLAGEAPLACNVSCLHTCSTVTAQQHSPPTALRHPLYSPPPTACPLEQPSLAHSQRHQYRPPSLASGSTAATTLLRERLIRINNPRTHYRKHGWDKELRLSRESSLLATSRAAEPILLLEQVGVNLLTSYRRSSSCLLVILV